LQQSARAKRPLPEPYGAHTPGLFHPKRTPVM
jgi:hypothetical protein